MKKYFIMLVACSCIACDGNNNKNEEDSAFEENGISSRTSEAKIHEQGLKLIENSDCTACHKEKERLIGPAYREVAERYEPEDTTIIFLANKIISGGAGNWGNVPMTPHPQHTPEEAEKMARYILSLD